MREYALTLSTLVFKYNVMNDARDVYVQTQDIHEQLYTHRITLNISSSSYNSSNSNFSYNIHCERPKYNLVPSINACYDATLSVIDTANATETHSGSSSAPCRSLAILTQSLYVLFSATLQSTLGLRNVRLTGLTTQNSSEDTPTLHLSTHSSLYSLLATAGDASMSSLRLHVTAQECLLSAVIWVLNRSFHLSSCVLYPYADEHSPLNCSLIEQHKATLTITSCVFRSFHTIAPLLRLRQEAPVRITSTQFDSLELWNAPLISFLAPNTTAPCAFAVQNVSVHSLTRNDEGPVFLSTPGGPASVELRDCSFTECLSSSLDGSIVSAANALRVVGCTFSGHTDAFAEDELCNWSGSLINIANSSLTCSTTVFANSSKGVLSASNASLALSSTTFTHNRPSSDTPLLVRYPSLQHNIFCSNGSTVSMAEWNTDTHALWILQQNCTLSNAPAELSSALFTPVLSSAVLFYQTRTETKKGVFRFTLTGSSFFPCASLSLAVGCAGSAAPSHFFSSWDALNSHETELIFTVQLSTLKCAESKEDSLAPYSVALQMHTADPHTGEDVLTHTASVRPKMAGSPLSRTYIVLIIVLSVSLFSVAVFLIVLCCVCHRYRKCAHSIAEESAALLHDDTLHTTGTDGVLGTEQSDELHSTGAQSQRRNRKKKGKRRRKKPIPPLPRSFIPGEGESSLLEPLTSSTHTGDGDAHSEMHPRGCDKRDLHALTAPQQRQRPSDDSDDSMRLITQSEDDHTKPQTSYYK